MIQKDTKLGVKSLLMFGLYVCLILYVFFWDKLFVESRFALVGVIAFSVLCILASGRIRIRASTILFGIILLWTMAGMPVGGLVSYGTTLAAAIAASFLLFIVLQNHNKSFMPIIITMVLCAALYGFFVYVNMISPRLMASINAATLKSGSLEFYRNISVYGYYPGFTGFNCMSGFFLTILLGFSVYKVLFPDRTKKLSRGWYLALAFFAFLATVLVQKRSLFIASAVAVCFMIMYSFLTKKRLKNFLLAFLLVGVFFAVVYMFLSRTAIGAQFIARFNDSDDVSSGRFGMYETLLRDWQSYFLLGNGTGTSRLVYSGGAHNIYIQVFYDHGIAGLALYMTWFILNFRYALVRFKKIRTASYEKCVLFVSIFVQIIFLIYGFFGNPINDLYIFLLYVFFAGIVYAKLPETEENAQLQEA